ncbi:glutaredoxin-C9-like [Trifolium pratense]|uniref:glutaredoxin-C9-like n=1 Tax=Trifolium pratense TaxID=57577 RepID=UPI001E692109|nr:glutaredoxin-C9-like [Trifolium pratense]
MHQAIPSISSHNNNFGNINENYYYNKKKESPNSSSHKGEEKMILNMVSENALIVIGRHGCCMTHVVKKLLQSLGVNPVIHEVEEEKDEVYVAKELESIIKGKEEQRNVNVQFPMVFIGGKSFGGLERVMATHISGELVPLLKQAGALWL